ncbi:hypothetical protein F4778DRAFT_776076 [Xylariomycetidae sp. FL2044]|nr:hypothetical protein F4778DRAFT_776076 [Xylariomycetidae sp. FL2044]
MLRAYVKHYNAAPDGLGRTPIVAQKKEGSSRTDEQISEVLAIVLRIQKKPYIVDYTNNDLPAMSRLFMPVQRREIYGGPGEYRSDPSIFRYRLAAWVLPSAYVTATSSTGREPEETPGIAGCWREDLMLRIIQDNQQQPQQPNGGAALVMWGDQQHADDQRVLMNTFNGIAGFLANEDPFRETTVWGAVDEAGIPSNTLHVFSADCRPAVPKIPFSCF